MAQITFSDDALVPKCITFGGTTLVVRWYAYIRSTSDNDIYLQRSVDGVLDPEVLTLQANPPAFGALQPGIEYFNFVVDPTDNTQAHLYWLSDGTLFRVTVTSTPIGEQPTLQQYDRVNNRADTTPPDIGLGALLVPTGPPAGAIPRPGFTLVISETPGNRLLVITPFKGPTEAYFPTVVEVFRAQNRGGSVLFETLFVGGQVQLTLEVPEATGGNTEMWHARSLNTVFGTQSNFAHAWDPGPDPTREATTMQAFSSLGGVLTPAYTKVSRLPVKINRQEADEDVQPFSSLGGTLTPSVVKQMIEPIKFIEQEADEDVQPFSSLGGCLTPTVIKQRVV